MRGAILFDRAVFAGEHFVLPLHIFCNIAFLINIALDKKGGHSNRRDVEVIDFICNLKGTL